MDDLLDLLILRCDLLLHFIEDLLDWLVDILRDLLVHDFVNRLDVGLLIVLLEHLLLLVCVLLLVDLLLGWLLLIHVDHILVILGHILLSAISIIFSPLVLIVILLDLLRSGVHLRVCLDRLHILLCILVLIDRLG